MCEKFAAGLLKGRPFGGFCILINNSLYNSFSHIECLKADSNLIVLKADDVLLANIYLPNACVPFYHDCLVNVLDCLSDICSNCAYKEILIDGDVNSNVLNNDSISNLITDRFLSLEAIHSFNYVPEITDNFFILCPQQERSFPH